MTTLSPTPPGRMTAAEFLDWAALEDVGRVELVDGEVVAMAGETRGHASVKGNIARALDRALNEKDSTCEAFISGIAITPDETTAYIPDILVDCATNDDWDRMDAVEPVIVVEVLSPSTRRKDLVEKLARYFDVPSIMHYLTVDWGARRVVHHARRGSEILATIYGQGECRLDPPGIVLDVADFWKGMPAKEGQK